MTGRGRAASTSGVPDTSALSWGSFLTDNLVPVTIGNVIVTGCPDGYLAGPLLEHESRHATQYVWCLGLPMLVLYVLAASASLLVCGNPGSWNVFERRACLEDGGYRDMAPWWRNKSGDIA